MTYIRKNDNNSISHKKIHIITQSNCKKMFLIKCKRCWEWKTLQRKYSLIRSVKVIKFILDTTIKILKLEYNFFN